MKILDLFAGIGGFSLAAHWMGWETVAFVERDKFCQKVLRKNFGRDIDIYDDIFKFSGEPFRGSVDIITGGFPCQPFSTAGKRKGVSDERYLFPETLRVVREVQPTWFVLENVAGLISMANESWDVKVASVTNRHTSDFDHYEAIFTRQEILLLGVICDEIERAGYAVQPIVVPASAVGAWHERKRIWIVANAKQSRARRFSGSTGHEGWGTREDRSAGLRQGDRTTRSSGTDAAGDDASKSSGCGRHDGSNHRQERHVQANEGIASESEPERERRVSGTCSACQDDADAHSPRLQGRNGGELPERSEQRIAWEGGSLLSHSASERLPDWAGGTLGRPAAVTEFERPGGREVERDFRGVAYGVSARVDRLKALGNSIVPQIALELFRAIELTERGTGYPEHGDRRAWRDSTPFP